MSIFRNTFQDDIKASLTARQEAMEVSNRTPEIIQYLNSRNSWIRMTSSVDVNNDKGQSARRNILLGGTLLGFVGLKSGVGSTLSKAYNYKSPSGIDNRLGLRPMAGITSMDIKSKSAYGSLREAVVNFQCWDIHQLEELELLYMRPGYTVLVEWGWSPYLDSSKKLVTTQPSFYDILSKGTTSRTKIFKDLYEKTKLSGGNYDAMFGYVKNYQWSARPDGGYDCQTTIISTGEIIESLKVNYVLPDLTRLNSSTTNVGFLDSEFTALGTAKSNVLKEHYEKNILAGVWAEAYYRLKDTLTTTVTPPPGGGGTPPPTTTPASATLSPNSIFKDKYAIIKAPYLKTTGWSPLAGSTQFQYYITLEAVFDVLNKYVIPKDEKGNLLMELSTQTEGYAGTAEDLLCVAHPIQVSVDPTVCVIKSPIWYDTTSAGILTSVSATVATSTPATKAAAITKAANDYRASKGNVAKLQANLKLFTNAVKAITDLAEYQLVNAAMGTQDIPYYLDRRVDATSDGSGDSPNIGGIMGESFTSEFIELKNKLYALVGAANVAELSTGTTYQTKIKITIPTGTPPPPTTIVAVSSIDNAKAALTQLKDLSQPFFSGSANGYDELGYIGNIFVNLNFLYQLSYDSNLESSDNKEKNEINLYKYIKNIMAAIQPAIGNVNSFEVHVDPIDNKARVIDVNFTKAKNPTLFELQVGNLKSVVRNYSLQSQIFPEQSSIIAIGSQAQGGQLGMQNNTMIDFNTNLIDRIIPKKDFGIASNDKLHGSGLSTTLASNLGGIIFMFATLQQTETAPGAATDISTLFNRCKSNLRDLIVYFQSITKSPGANRNIIPFKFSFEMDGIGGLVIGNLFTINSGVLPKGYKGGGAGVKLAQTVTGISHTLNNNNDWTTKIDALNIVLGDGPNSIAFKDLDLTTLIDTSFKNSLQSQLPPTPSGGGGFPPLLSFGPCTVPEDPKNNIVNKGWFGRQVAKVKTVVDPAVEGPKLKATYGKVLAHNIMATIQREQSFSGTNWNLGGFDITDGGWTFDPLFHNGYWVGQEGGTLRCKAFVSFISYDTFIAAKVKSFKAKGFDTVTTADGFAEKWIKDWNAGGIFTLSYPGKINNADRTSAAAVAWRAKNKAELISIWNDNAKYVK